MSRRLKKFALVSIESLAIFFPGTLAAELLVQPRMCASIQIELKNKLAVDLVCLP